MHFCFKLHTNTFYQGLQKNLAASLLYYHLLCSHLFSFVISYGFLVLGYFPFSFPAWGNVNFKELRIHVQGSAKRRSPGLVNFVTALDHHICLALPAAFTQPGAHLLAKPCTHCIHYTPIFQLNLCAAISIPASHTLLMAGRSEMKFELFQTDGVSL